MAETRCSASLPAGRLSTARALAPLLVSRPALRDSRRGLGRPGHNAADSPRHSSPTCRYNFALMYFARIIFAVVWYRLPARDHGRKELSSGGRREADLTPR